MKIKRIQYLKTTDPEKLGVSIFVSRQVNRGSFFSSMSLSIFFDNFDLDPARQLLFPDTKVSDPYWIRRPPLYLGTVFRMSKTLQNIHNILDMAHFFLLKHSVSSPADLPE
jgi:hypothetical protein